MDEFKPISLKNIQTYSLKKRQSKVSIKDFGSSWISGGKMSLWFERLPNILAGNDLRRLIDRLTIAVKEKKTIIVAMGAHTIKVGLSPVILDLMEREIITGIAMNGAGIIHDLEVAMVGATSEDVDNELPNGRFGMAKETGEFLNRAIKEGAQKGEGLGYSVGKNILKASFPHNRFSLLAEAARMNIPLTVHVAIGTDIIHFHPTVDGSAIGKASHLDFRIFATLVSNLEGGVYINLGSAVILPEVFLKALTLVRNLGFNVKGFTTVDMDFIRHYRPMVNVVKRPTLEGGEGFSLTGHNEIMFPLLAAALIENLEKKFFS
ncbi:MAG: hypothetical protein AMJ45_06945 [Syntrophobacter sp. DG_60]|nr:MAG: hypothetical protein AMJ45_06945 [Syntrophobacter sp. DG_60]